MLETFKARATKCTEGMQVKVNSRTFTFLADESADFGGTNKAMNPIEITLGALGACQAIVAAAFAKAHSVTFEDFYVEIEGDIDTDGYMGVEGIRPGFQEVRIQMHFKSNESQEKLEKFGMFIEKTCPVGDSLAHGVKFVNNGVIKD